MIAVGYASLPISLAVLRSVLRPEPAAWNPDRVRGQHPRPWLQAMRLVGHLAASAFIFISFITLVWLTSLVLNFLHSVHPFSDDVFHFFGTLESVFIRIDAALSGVVLLRGLWRYVLNVIRGNS